MQPETAARALPEADWIALGEASRLLGVAPGTLRRWSDAGQVATFVTPGGHRRYRRSSLERMLPVAGGAPLALRSTAVALGRLARAYRSEARIAATGADWLERLSEDQRTWFRAHGRRLATLIAAGLDDSIRPENALALEADAEAAAYGRKARELGLSLSQAVEGFLRFRRPFLHELAAAAGRRGLDVRTTTDLIERAERSMDRLVVAAMAGHTAARARPGRASTGTDPQVSGEGRTMVDAAT